MRNRSLRAALVAGATAVLAALALVGCSKDKLSTTRFTNQPPTVELTNAPVSADRSNPYFYAYRVNWAGNDPDGRIVRYEYAIDPKLADTVWIKTQKNEEILFFRATSPDSVIGNSQPTSSDYHVFVIKAVDDQGAESPRRVRAFYSYTIAPTVAILNPTPSKLLSPQVTPSVRMDWTGNDPDGQFSQKPVKYKYRLFEMTSEVQEALTNPNSLRIPQEASGWAGWDSTSADTQFVQFTNLTPNKSYLFVVIGFDEAGAYNPVWDLNSNMLFFGVSYGVANGPRIHFYNTFVDYRYASGGYSLDRAREVPIEVPSGRPIPVNWDADAPSGARIQGFRWRLHRDDEQYDLTDYTARTDEATDYFRWSQSSPTMPNSVTLRPLTDGIYRFFLECTDNNGQKSLGILRLTVVTPTFDKELLIVDDTRLEAEKWAVGSNPLTTCPTIYTKPWPSAAELDTFLYARGNTPWRCARVANSITPPGLFAGYSFDTLGTRLGYEDPALGTPLSLLGKYRNIIWLVDADGAGYTRDLNQQLSPVTVLYTLCAPNKSSALATYVQAGGRVWLAGGGGAYASLKNFDRATNNQGQTTVYANSTGELVQGRLMYDGAHWRSSIGVTKSGITTYRYDFPVYTQPGNQGLVNRVVATPWSHPTRFGTLSSPNYSRLPAEMRWKSAATDPLTPTRTNSSQFYLTSYPSEYLLLNNSILEDVNPDPEVVEERSVLDTLYQSQGVVLLTSPNRAPTMTYYHGNEANQFVFSGFSIWSYARQDCIALVDFVLQDIWGLTRQPVSRGSQPAAMPGRGPQPNRVVTPAQRAISASVPSGAPRE